MKKAQLLLLLLFCVASNFKAQDLTSDSLALVAIYNATDGPNWNVDDWLVEPLEDWKGIEVNDDRVTRVNFNLFGLKNEMPDDIYDLTALTHFQIREGGLLFKVDDRLEDMESLELISFFAANVEFEDISIVCAFSNLKFLTLNTIKTNGVIPPCLFDLSLDRVNFIRLEFDGQDIPKEFGTMESLQGLVLSRCGFTGQLPEEICNLDQMKFLYVDENQFTGSIPSCLPGPNYIQLVIDNCEFDGPINFDNLGGDLGILRCNGNSFTGDLIDLPAMPNAYSFQFEGSEFTGSFNAKVFDKEWILNVNITDNNIEEMLNWSGFGERLNLLKVAGNKLDFSDLEKIDITDKVSFTYAPQQLLTVDEEHILDTGTSITFNCSAGGTNTTYQWYKDDIIVDDATTAQLELTDLQVSDAGVYHCEAVNLDFPDLTLQTGGFTLDVLSGINNIVSNNLEIFPNPASQELFVVFNDNIEKIQLINTLGKRFKTEHQVVNGSVQIGLQMIPNGMYFLELSSEEKRFVEKIQIQKN